MEHVRQGQLLELDRDFQQRGSPLSEEQSSPPLPPDAHSAKRPWYEKLFIIAPALAVFVLIAAIAGCSDDDDGGETTSQSTQAEDSGSTEPDESSTDSDDEQDQSTIEDGADDVELTVCQGDDAGVATATVNVQVPSSVEPANYRITIDFDDGSGNLETRIIETAQFGSLEPGEGYDLNAVANFDAGAQDVTCEVAEVERSAS